MKGLPPAPPDMPRCPKHPTQRPIAVRIRPLETAALWWCVTCDTDLGPTVKPLAPWDTDAER